MERAVSNVRSTVSKPAVFLSSPPTATITTTSAPSLLMARRSLGHARQISLRVDEHADLATADGAWFFDNLRKRGRHDHVGERLPILGHLESETGRHSTAQAGVDVRQDRKLAFLDLLVADLTQFEGERLHDMGLLRGGEAPVEHRRLGEVIVEGCRGAPLDWTIHDPRRLDIAALISSGHPGRIVNAIPQVGRDSLVHAPSSARNWALVTEPAVP